MLTLFLLLFCHFCGCVLDNLLLAWAHLHLESIDYDLIEEKSLLSMLLLCKGNLSLGLDLVSFLLQETLREDDT